MWEISIRIYKGQKIASYKDIVIPHNGDFITVNREMYIVKSVCYNYNIKSVNILVESI